MRLLRFMQSMKSVKSMLRFRVHAKLNEKYAVRWFKNVKKKTFKWKVVINMLSQSKRFFLNTLTKHLVYLKLNYLGRKIAWWKAVRLSVEIVFKNLRKHLLGILDISEKILWETQNNGGIIGFIKVWKQTIRTWTVCAEFGQ